MRDLPIRSYLTAHLFSSALDVAVKQVRKTAMETTQAALGQAPIGRRRLDADQSRTMILDAAEQLMRNEGYGAVTTRRVATMAGLKPSLVHYYYRTTDDLLLAFYRRSAAHTRAQLDAVIASDRPLLGLWRMNIDRERTALAAEFVALANHRKVIGVEISRTVTAHRELQSRVVAKALQTARSTSRTLQPDIVTVLLAAVGIGLVMESQVGVVIGHDATLAFIEALIADVEKPAI